jgi:hypothetical protein
MSEPARGDQPDFEVDRSELSDRLDGLPRVPANLPPDIRETLRRLLEEKRDAERIPFSMPDGGGLN